MKLSEPSAPRVVLDTQVLLRGAVARSGSLTTKIYDAWRSGPFTLLLTEAILVEIEDVLRRPEVLEKLRLSPIEARGLIILLRRRGLFVRPTAPIRRSRDAADDKFLECAVAGPADYLVSADADLLSLGEIEGIPILDVPTFWRKLAEVSSLSAGE